MGEGAEVEEERNRRSTEGRKRQDEGLRFLRRWKLHNYYV